jgi:hypothetical protein
MRLAGGDAFGKVEMCFSTAATSARSPSLKGPAASPRTWYACAMCSQTSRPVNPLAPHTTTWYGRWAAALAAAAIVVGECVGWRVAMGVGAAGLAFYTVVDAAISFAAQSQFVFGLPAEPDRLYSLSIAPILA